MIQGLEDERKIVEMYEDILGCKVHKVGFKIHPHTPLVI